MHYCCYAKVTYKYDTYHCTRLCISVKPRNTYCYFFVKINFESFRPRQTVKTSRISGKFTTFVEISVARLGMRYH